MSLMTDVIKIGALTIPNRIVRSATAEHLADKGGVVPDRYAMFYERLAMGGAGLIISGNIFISPEARTSTRAPLLDTDAALPGLKKATDAVHEHEAYIFAQLNHGGREARVSKAPSPIKNPLTRVKPSELTGDEIFDIVAQFGAAAERAKRAGFDGVQIHGAHGYLVSQFLSPQTNRRTDAWGGDIDGRMAFVMAIYDSIRTATGPEFPISIKLNGSDHVEDGMTLPDAIRIATALEAKGIDAIEVSGGVAETAGFFTIRGDIPVDELLGNRSPLERFMGKRALAKLQEQVRFEPGYNLPEAKAIKQAVRIPVICVGGMADRALIRQTLCDDSVDMVALSRALIREPTLPKKFFREEQSAATCINCNKCFVAHEPLRCRLDKK